MVIRLWIGKQLVFPAALPSACSQWHLSFGNSGKRGLGYRRMYGRR
uniref:Uncharacterized protein n=1 Tax=Arundo donax TaxID=35708 RepID=A0A0A8YGJ9_ARUDO